MYWDDKYGTHSVSPEVSGTVTLGFMARIRSNLLTICQNLWSIAKIWFSEQVISSMRALMTEDSNNAVSNSFLLDDDSRFVLRSVCAFLECFSRLIDADKLKVLELIQSSSKIVV